MGLTAKLDVLANTFAKLKFSPSDSNLDEFCFQVNRQNHSLIFRHGNIEVKVDGFKLVDFDNWVGKQYPPVSRQGIVSYYYEAKVEWQVGDKKGGGKGALGYFGDRRKILKSLPATLREYDVIDSLLATLDKVMGRLFHTELLTKEKAVPRQYPEDREGGRPNWDSF